MKGLILKISAVFVLHCLVGFLFYRGRVVQRLPIFDSDFIVFAVPFIVAFVVYYWIFLRSPYFPTRLWPHISVVALLSSLFLTFLSHWASLIWAFNTYGT